MMYMRYSEHVNAPEYLIYLRVIHTLTLFVSRLGLGSHSASTLTRLQTHVLVWHVSSGEVWCPHTLLLDRGN